MSGETGNGPAAAKKTTVVVEEGGLEFVTPDGRLLARLGANGADGVVFTLVAGGDRPGVEVRVAPGLSAVYVLEAVTGGTAAMRAGSGAASVLAVRGRESRGGVEIIDSPEGAAALVRDAQGGLAASVGEGRWGGVFNAFRSGGGVAVSLSGGEQGGDVTALNADGTTAAVMGANGGAGVLAVFNAGGAPVFAVPVNRMPGFTGRSASGATPDGEEAPGG